jgi:hypothetical protein
MILQSPFLLHACLLALSVGPKFLEVYSLVLPGAVIVADITSHATALQQTSNMESREWNELALEVAT